VDDFPEQAAGGFELVGQCVAMKLHRDGKVRRLSQIGDAVQFLQDACAMFGGCERGGCRARPDPDRGSTQRLRRLDNPLKGEPFIFAFTHMVIAAVGGDLQARLPRAVSHLARARQIAMRYMDVTAPLDAFQSSLSYQGHSGLKSGLKP